MVTLNVKTNLDIANGARGTIERIILHSNEPAVGNKPIVYLQYMPAYVLVKLNRTRVNQLDGLTESVIPIEPATKTFTINVKTSRGQIQRKTVKQCQLPIIGAYAFTDYRLQGQTIAPVIADIARPPCATLDLANVYVALSQSSGRDNIRILRDFADETVLQPLNTELAGEDNQLERLNIVSFLLTTQQSTGQ
ncbi:uncharacterized protein PHACADRAFT_155497 [Phanerochaete carnosa HHB-10118-sp]|uniref:Uncharacterized protein n=1 Tax=Phanerochaete carnosa (strain HHB-10118-sp) TaxID=650164 RepID=K5WLR8_PHACS|nr:uncharacterized protein PHACADRAFT_155497 [Phanerochaete carnosa HHB-10118-sp]EKM60350.1 hypothetical protein PHACADRAFT_155497 [Phanerochaete carnosa HHB-10118-sp]